MVTQQSQPEIAEKPEVRALVQEADTLFDTAQDFKIASAADYVTAADWLKIVKGKQKDLKALRETITKPMRVALDAVRAMFSRPEKMLELAEQALKKSMNIYNAEQDRIRIERQRKLDEAAEKDRQRLEQQANRAATKGQVDKAVELQERAAMVVAPIVQEEPINVLGISRRENWHAEVIDLRALVKGVAEGQVPLAAIEANRTFLNGQARALRAELRYPGVRAVPERTIAAGSA